ncbi:MAG: hypothetical protein IPK97_10085 [Ahniella sp.]|nr:hypothetical protein [Ahniella sp.]
MSAPTNASIAAGTGTGTITNDDIAGVVITQSSGSTDVTEVGATDSYTLLLTSQPTNNVSITLTPNTQVTAATSPVVFTPGNWNIAQTVTVTAIDDNVVEGAHTGSITHAVQWVPATTISALRECRTLVSPTTTRRRCNLPRPV